MADDVFGYTIRVVAAGGGTQPAGDCGGRDDRGVRGAGAICAVDCTAGPGAHRFASAADGAFGVPLVRDGRVGTRHPVANHLWRAHFDAGGDVRGGNVADTGAYLRVNRGLLRRLPRSLSERSGDERLHV